MVAVVIPPVRDGGGALVPATATVVLVDAANKAAMGFAPDGQRVERRVLELGEDGASVVLTPTALIERPDAAPTWYRVVIRTANQAQTYRVQVPDVAGPLALADLVAAAAAEDVAVGWYGIQAAVIDGNLY